MDISHFTFRLLPDVHVTNDFFVRKEVLDRFRVPMALFTSQGEMIWQNQWATQLQWSHPREMETLKHFVAATLRRQNGVHNEFRELFVLDDWRTTLAWYPLRSLSREVESYLVWMNDMLPEAYLHLLHIGLAIAQDKEFVYVNPKAQAALGEGLQLGGDWDDFPTLPRWNQILEENRDMVFVKKVDDYELRVHSHRDLVFLEIGEDLMRSDKTFSARDLSMILHEVRNPLAAITGYVELSQMSANEEQQEYLSRAIEELQRLSRLTDNMHWLGDAPAGVSMQRVALSPVMEKVLRLLGPAAEANHIRLQSQISGAVNVSGVADRIEQVILNVVKNSIEALTCQRDGTIIIGFDSSGGDCDVVWVEDNGPGIPDHYMKVLFTQKKTSKPDGSGLGLLIVRQLMQKMQGGITVAAGTAGTRVSLQFPKN